MMSSKPSALATRSSVAKVGSVPPASNRAMTDVDLAPLVWRLGYGQPVPTHCLAVLRLSDSGPVFGSFAGLPSASRLTS
jgi:hypothetical protein